VKCLHSVSFLFAVSLFLNAVIYGQSTNQTDSLFKANNNHTNNPPSLTASQRFHYGLSLGTGYVSGGSYYSGNFNTISPSLNYLLTPKFSVEVGGVFTNSNINFNKIPSMGLSQNYFQQTNDALAYASGHYSLTKEVTLTGSLFSTINQSSMPINSQSNLNFKGMDMGLNYKITEFMNVGAQIMLMNGINNLYNFNSFVQFSPYHSNMSGW
jgi:hypothetical protein